MLIIRNLNLISIQSWTYLSSTQHLFLVKPTHSRESSFNMTRGNEDIEGGLRKFLGTRKGGSEQIRWGSENLYTLNPKGGGPLKD